MVDEKINPDFTEGMILEQRELSIQLVETLLMKIKWLMMNLPKETTYKKILRQDAKDLRRDLSLMKKAYKRGESFIFTNVVALVHIELGIQAMRCIT